MSITVAFNHMQGPHHAKGNEKFVWHFLIAFGDSRWGVANDWIWRHMDANYFQVYSIFCELAVIAVCIQ